MSETNSPKLIPDPTANWRPGQIVLGNPIFEIAVYRKSPRELKLEYDASLTKYLQSLEPQYPEIDIDSSKYQGLRFIRDQFWEKYGQPYPYNQVIAWVVLFAKRDQILGEYYKITEKRLTRNCRRHRVKGQGKCFAIPLAGNETNRLLPRSLKSCACYLLKAHSKDAMSTQPLLCNSLLTSIGKS